MQERVSITEIWTFQLVPELDLTALDLAGYKVEATDGSVGKVDEATYESGGSYLVVDTGPWILGRTVMIPAGTVERIDTENERIHVALTRDEIKSSPEFDVDKHREDSDYRTRLGEHYSRPPQPGMTSSEPELPEDVAARRH
jgi:hypothetical protein